MGAQTNEATDLIADRLRQRGYTPEHVKRLDSYHRRLQECNFQELKDGGFIYRQEDHQSADEQMRDLNGVNVVVSTVFMAAHLYGIGFGREDMNGEVGASPVFDYVMIDEAGQLTDPATAIPATLLAQDGTMVLAGDPKQLGPLVRSTIGRNLNLEKSAIQRITEARGITGVEPLDQMIKKSCVKLKITYRPHPYLVDLFSQPFYDGKVESHCWSEETTGTSCLTCGETLSQSSGCSCLNFFWDWQRFGNAEQNPIPIMVYHVDGIERREWDSPSWMNQMELATIKGIWFSLMQQYPNLSPRDIGIISPYSKQVRNLRAWQHQQGAKAAGMQIGTVENFQGQEKKVIILSLVRSKKVEAIPDDKKAALGFLGAPERTNVAISRAKAVLIVVGNVKLLSRYESWYKILRIAFNYNCVANAPLQDMAMLPDPAISSTYRPQVWEVQRGDQPFPEHNGAYYAAE